MKGYTFDQSANAFLFFAAASLLMEISVSGDEKEVMFTSPAIQLDGEKVTSLEPTTWRLSEEASRLPLVRLRHFSCQLRAFSSPPLLQLSLSTNLARKVARH